MVSIVAINITGLLVERDRPGPQPYPKPIIADAFDATQIETTVRASLEDYFQSHGILADLEVEVVDPAEIEEENEEFYSPQPQVSLGSAVNYLPNDDIDVNAHLF